MKPSHSRLGVLILISLLLVGAGLTGAHAAASSTSFFGSVSSFFSALLPTTGYVATGGGGGLTCPTDRDCILSVSIAGSGTVTSNPAGISCSTGNTGTCSASFPPDQLVALSKSPSTVCGIAPCFAGWSGACTGTGSCSPSMSADRSVTATFLTPATTHTLTIAKSGTGSGTVTSTDAKINCGTGAGCSATYPPGTQVFLSASVPYGTTFAGWSGGYCSGTGTCTVTMDASKTITATFSAVTYYGLVLYKAGNGAGTFSVTPAAASSCGIDCYSYPSGATVTVTANSATGSSATNAWGTNTAGSCKNAGGTVGVDTRLCTLPMNAAKSITATFSLTPYALSVSKTGTGTGTVTSTPSGINCVATCTSQSANYNYGSSVILAAAPDSAVDFAGWSGACTNAVGDCTVSMTAAKSVTATFNKVQNFLLTAQKAGAGASASSITSVSPPTGINCGIDCTETYTPNSVVTLRANAGTGTTFTAWSGCTPVSGTDCSVTMNAQKTATATFGTQVLPLTVSAAGVRGGTGYIIDFNTNYINCGVGSTGTCTANIAYGTSVDLSPSAGAYSHFSGFGGDCTGNSCTLTMNAAKTVSSSFTIDSYALTAAKSGTGSGTVQSGEAVKKIDCGATCSATYDHGSSITLSAAPATGSTFAGWSGGGCTGTAGCIVSLTSATTVTAAFSLKPVILTATSGGVGRGTVTSGETTPKINCAPKTTCTATYFWGDSIALTATGDAATAGTFGSWNGCPSGSTTSTCSFTINADTSVQANFATTPAIQVTVASTGGGGGLVTDSAAEILCDGVSKLRCSATYSPSTSVILTATPNSGSTFSGWTGCTASATYPNKCSVYLDGTYKITANFAPTPTGLVTVSHLPANPVVPQAVEVSVAVDQPTVASRIGVSITATVASTRLPNKNEIRSCTISGTSATCNSGTQSSGSCQMVSDKKGTCKFTFSGLPVDTYTYQGIEYSSGQTATGSVAVGGGTTEDFPIISSISPLSGTIGSTMVATINGVNLGTATTADFGPGVTSQVVSKGSTSLTLNLVISNSASTGQRGFKVTNAYGTTDSSVGSKFFTISPNCAALLKAFFSKQKVAPGEQVTLNINLEVDNAKGAEFWQACIDKSRGTKVGDPEKK